MLALGLQMALQPGVFLSKINYPLKASSPELLGPGAWKLVCRWDNGFYQVCSNSGPRSQNGPAPGATGFEPYKYIENNIKNRLLQTHLAQMLKIWYKALHSGPSQSLFKFVALG